MSASERAAANRAARGIVVRAVIPAPTPKPAVDFAALRARRRAWLWGWDHEQ